MFHALRTRTGFILVTKREATFPIANAATDQLISTRRETTATFDAADPLVHQHLIVSHEEMHKGWIGLE